MTMAAFSAPHRYGVRPYVAIEGRRGVYLGNSEDYVTRFNMLVRKWRAETAYVSSTKVMFDHPAFVEIVGMGELVIPLIISEISRQPDLLLGALTRITGENPVSEAERGNVYLMAIAWIEWYRRRP